MEKTHQIWRSRLEQSAILCMFGGAQTWVLGLYCYGLFGGAGHGTDFYGKLFRAPEPLGQIMLPIAGALLPFARRVPVAIGICCILGTQWFYAWSSFYSETVGGHLPFYSELPWWVLLTISAYLIWQVVFIVLLARQVFWGLGISFSAPKSKLVQSLLLAGLGSFVSFPLATIAHRQLYDSVSQHSFSSLLLTHPSIWGRLLLPAFGLVFPWRQERKIFPIPVCLLALHYGALAIGVSSHYSLASLANYLDQNSRFIPTMLWFLVVFAWILFVSVRSCIAVGVSLYPRKSQRS